MVRKRQEGVEKYCRGKATYMNDSECSKQLYETVKVVKNLICFTLELWELTHLKDKSVV